MDCGILPDTSTGHPFRRELPPHVVETPEEVETPATRKPLGPVGLFMLTFVSAFLAFSSFLA